MSDPALDRDKKAVQLLRELRKLCEENSEMGRWITKWLGELDARP